MTRARVVVRPADASAVADVVELWTAFRGENGAAEALSPRALHGKVTALLDRGDVHVLLAYDESTPVGYLLLTQGCTNPLAEVSCVSIDHLFVVKALRRHGVARQLLASATAYAQKVGAEQVVSNVPSAGRDANRFFARLGFTATVVRRVVPTATLLRRLAGEEPRVPVDLLLRRRRIARLRSAAAADPAPPQ